MSKMPFGKTFNPLENAYKENKIKFKKKFGCDCPGLTPTNESGN